MIAEKNMPMARTIRRVIAKPATKVSEIQQIEAEMRALFHFKIINDDIVALYNRLENKWKKLNKY